MVKAISKTILSIEFRIYFILILVFTSLVIGYVFISYPQQRALIRSIMEDQVNDLADSYFDSINVLMLSGAMHTRKSLQEKLLERPDITEVRLIRGKSVMTTFGPGHADEKVMDELDQQALDGQHVLIEQLSDDTRSLTVVKPIYASSNYKGSNCLTCHQVSEGEVLGAVRISYSLGTIDQQSNHLQNNLIILLIGISLTGLATTIIVMRIQVIRRLCHLRERINHIEQESDLTATFDVKTSDELGSTMLAFNAMLNRFGILLKELSLKSGQLNSAAESIHHNAQITQKAVEEQHSGTDLMAAAVNEMEATSREVKLNAESTAASSKTADEKSRLGVEQANSNIASMETLSSELQSASETIGQLNSHTQQVTNILTVIKGIAEQTNLLALNAAIEAARAGESGRGFAVVADEVRALATRTHASAEEIEETLTLLQSEAVNAVEVMERATEHVLTGKNQITEVVASLERIAELVSEINALNQSLANIAEDQLSAATEINTSVHSISTLAETSAKNTQDTSLLANQLLTIASELNKQSKQFKLE